jgi:hypothetical protein
MCEKSKDNILEYFVAAVNQHGFKLDISLIMNGAIVTGTLVSDSQYFGELSKTFEDDSDVARQLEKCLQIQEASQKQAAIKKCIVFI